MLIPILLFAVGLVLLIKGGDWFVDGATGIARRFKLPEILIGSTNREESTTAAAGLSENSFIIKRINA